MTVGRARDVHNRVRCELDTYRETLRETTLAGQE